MTNLLGVARTGGLDGLLLASGHFFATNYTKPLLFMGDGTYLAGLAENQHLLGSQWGMMNETGSYPGQAWLWLYSMWYQIPPYNTAPNADLLVVLTMGILTLVLAFVPHIPICETSRAGSQSIASSGATTIAGGDTPEPRGHLGGADLDDHPIAGICRCNSSTIPRASTESGSARAVYVCGRERANGPRVPGRRSGRGGGGRGAVVRHPRPPRPPRWAVVRSSPAGRHLVDRRERPP